MGASPGWNTEEGAKEWKQVALGDLWLPGVCTIDLVPLERDIDTKKAKGKSGHTLTDNGYKPTAVVITVWIWTDEQHIVWLQVFPKINPLREGATKDPFEIRHPAVMEAELGAMFVRKIELGKPSTKDGRKIKITCEPWFDKPKDVKKGTGKAKSASSANPRTPIGNYMQPGTDPFKKPGSGLADPSDPNSIMEKALSV